MMDLQTIPLQTTLRDLLKLKTREIHESIETTLQLDTANYARYQRIILAWTAAVIPLESFIWSFQTEWQNLGILSFEREKSQLIFNDLEYFGLHGKMLYSFQMPQLSSFSHALGAAYVLEISTLNSQSLSKVLKSKLGIDQFDGCSFYWGYDERTQLMWKKFLEALDKFEASTSTNQKDQVIFAATETFKKLEKLFKQI